MTCIDSSYAEGLELKSAQPLVVAINFSCASLGLQCIFGDSTSKLVTTVSFHILSNSLFAHHTFYSRASVHYINHKKRFMKWFREYTIGKISPLHVHYKYDPKRIATTLLPSKRIQGMSRLSTQKTATWQT
jgi:hypothetical protein